MGPPAGPPALLSAGTEAPDRKPRARPRGAAPLNAPGARPPQQVPAWQNVGGGRRPGRRSGRTDPPVCGLRGAPAPTGLPGGSGGVRRRAAPWQRAAPRGGGARAPRAPLLGRWFGPARARAGAVRRSPGPGRPPRGAEGTRRLGARGSVGPPLGVWAQQAHAQIGCQPKKVGVLT